MFKFKIGADPEFIILMGNKQINARKIMESQFERGILKTEHGELGQDGRSSTAEFRPKPENDPRQTAKNIGLIYKEFVNHMPLISGTTLSFADPIGGHIHLELPSVEIENDDKRLAEISLLLGIFYLPLLLGENFASIKRRKGSYGQITDYRVHKPSETVRTFEFRCPSAEWITHEKIASATLSYMATVFHEIIENRDTVKNIAKRYRIKTGGARALQDIILESSHLFIRELIKDIRRSVKQMEFYPEYKKEIDYLFRPKDVIKDKKEVNWDLTRGWKLAVNKIGAGKFTKINKKKNTLSEFFPIYHNDQDEMTDVYKTALVNAFHDSRVNPKNRYFIFGIKEGFNHLLAINGQAEIFAGAERMTDKQTVQKVDKIFSKVYKRLRDYCLPDIDTYDSSKTSYMIGIPMEMRKPLKIKPFLNLIYKLENNMIKPQVISEEQFKEMPEGKNNDLDITKLNENQPMNYEASSTAVMGEAPQIEVDDITTRLCAE